MAHEVVGEHIILTGEHLTGNATGEVETIFDGKVHLPVVKSDMRHYVHDSLNRLRIVTFSKNAVEFRDNMPIFVHAKVYYICLATII